MSVEKATAEPEYWRSIDEWMDSERFRTLMKDEFPEDADEWLDPVSRRQFVQLMGASIALAGAGCNPSLKPAPQKKVLPYVKQPDQIIPGVPLFYATAMAQAGGVGIGMIVKSLEGRPIKCEGNPQHNDSQGSLELQALAAPLTMYDPDRSKGVQMGSESTTFDRAITAIKSELAKRADKQGEGVRILTEPTTSPTLMTQMEEFKKRYPKSKWIQYEPINKDNITKATQAALNANVTAVYDYDHADVILSLDSDFLSGPGSVGHARDFATRRKLDLVHKVEIHEGHKHEHESHEKTIDKAAKKMNRLYVVEGMLTSTGAVADHRLPLKPSLIEAFARALAIEMKIPGVTPQPNLSDAAKAWIAPLAKELLAKKKKALVVAGPQMSPATHMIVMAINKLLEAVAAPGKDDHLPIKYVTLPETKSTSDIKTLVDEMQAGQVGMLIMSGVNPVYDAPVDLDFAKALDAVKANKGTVIHHGLYADESAYPHANWHINAAHFLECWGDVRGHDGTAVIQQTLLNVPLFGGKSLIELVAKMVDSPVLEAKELVKATWLKHFKDKKDELKKEIDKKKEKGEKTEQLERDLKKISGDPEILWQEALRDGVVPQTEYPVATVGNVNLEKLNDKGFTQVGINELEVQFRPSPVLYDGRQANNGWLQELPQPITNLTWDNAAMMSPQTAQDLHITQSFAWTGGERGSTETEKVKVIVNKRELSIPAHIVPGMADKFVVLHLGHGREKPGSKGKPNEDLGGGGGFDAYKLRATDAPWTVLTTDVLRENTKYVLAVAGAHAAMESRRPVRHATVEEFKKDETFAQIPAASAGEFEEIRALTPGTVENFELLYGPRKEGDKDYPNPYADDHKHEHTHSIKHDKRLKKLSLYVDNPTIVKKTDGTKDSAEKAYRRWGMTIDLGSCIGCSACTLACVAENNIPVVGKKQVTMGRAMHWIRIDRYFSIPGKEVMQDELGAANIKAADRREKIKNSAAIRTHFQPVPCQQCEKAQCEVVCPVGATAHSADGLNDMAYNRCVGTRYCANNCAYKVRRFNFLQYADYTTDSLKLLNNPEVTVRTRGVMEKCTYCVQRIRTAEIEAEREWEKKIPGPIDPATVAELKSKDDATKKLAALSIEGKLAKSHPELVAELKKGISDEVIHKLEELAKGKPARERDAHGHPKILDGEVLTACQQACPSSAISFGDLNDPKSEVLKTKAQPHNYGLLAEFNTMPRTSYLAAIRNPNPDMPQGA